MTIRPRFKLRSQAMNLMALVILFGAFTCAAQAKTDTATAITYRVEADTSAQTNRPWQVNLSLAATHGLIALGRDFGLNYWQVALQSIGYSSRDGLVFGLGVGYARRFCQGNSPYVGFAFDFPWTESSQWDTPLWIPAVGYEFRQPNYYLHFEGFLGTPLDSDFTEAWGYGFGIGFGIPF
jgi:hypothetical protein